MVDHDAALGSRGVTNGRHGRLAGALSLYLIPVYLAAIQTKGAPPWFQMPAVSARTAAHLRSYDNKD
jgi:hypothetical protein